MGLTIPARTEIKQLPEVGSERLGDNHLGHTKVHEIDDEHGDCSNGRDEHFVPPTDVKHIIANA